MPDKAAYPLASMLVPFGVARDTLAQVDERIGVLSSGVGEIMGALAQRMNALPASAVFQPFGIVGQGGLGNVARGLAGKGQPQSAGPARQARRAIKSAARQGVQRAVSSSAPARLSDIAFPPGFMAQVVKRLVQASADSAPRKTTRPRKTGPVQAAARAAQQAAEEPAAINPLWPTVSGQLAADLVGQLLKTIAPAASAFGGLPLGRGLAALATPGMPGLSGMGRVVQDAFADVMGGIAPPRRRPQARVPRGTPPALAGAAMGGFDSVQFGVLLAALLQGIAQGKPAASNATRRGPRSAAGSPAAAAPRAAARLLPPASSSAPEAVASATPRAAPPDCTDDGHAALDELHRALLDQAWLRGVDLR